MASRRPAATWPPRRAHEYPGGVQVSGREVNHPSALIQTGPPFVVTSVLNSMALIDSIVDGTMVEDSRRPA
jgi:hypothetical protein